MKKIILLICFCLTVCCNSDDTDSPIIPACGTNNPIEDLPWLKTLANQLQEDQNDLAEFFFIEIAEFNGETIFLYANCCAVCNTVVPIYNCEGESIGFLNGEITSEQIQNRQIIFKRDDFSCQF